MKKLRYITLSVFFTTLSLVTFSVSDVFASGFVNHIGMKFVEVPAGEFIMGSCLQASDKDAFLGEKAKCKPGTYLDKSAYRDEGPQHRVRIGSFHMGAYEVTLGQYKEFLRANKGRLSDSFIKCNRERGGGNTDPVLCASWFDAQAFVEWLNATKPASDRGSYRLPSESEWEYAARAGTTTKYSFGNDKGNLGQYAWFHGNSGERAHSVGQKQPNGFGLYDMHGNVWEWVEDCYHDNYGGAPTDGSAWVGEPCKYRVLRGGSWIGNPDYLRSAVRSRNSPDYANFNMGFRVARTLP